MHHDLSSDLNQVLLLKDAYRLESFISICPVCTPTPDAPLIMSIIKRLCLSREIVVRLGAVICRWLIDRFNACDWASFMMYVDVYSR